MRKPTPPRKTPQRVTDKAMADAQHLLEQKLWNTPKYTPPAVRSMFDNNMGALVDNWEAVAEMFKLSPAVTATLGEDLADTELRTSVFKAFNTCAGYVVMRTPHVVAVRDMKTEVTRKHKEVPTKLAHRLAILKMQDPGTYVRNCGYRYDDTLFFIMETTDEH